MNHLVWYRSDLRVKDNPALNHACSDGRGDTNNKVYAVYCITEQQWCQHGLGPRKIQLIKNAIAELDKQLTLLNIPLIIINSETFCDSVNSLKEVINELNIDCLSFNLEYELNEQQRDEKIQTELQATKVKIYKFHDQCLIPPGSIKTKNNDQYKIFTPFKKQWAKQLNQYITPPLPAPSARSRNNINKKSLEKIRSKLKNTVKSQSLFKQDLRWPISEEFGHQLFENFNHQLLADYQINRDRPDLKATSSLSTYLSLGILSPRQCFYPVLFSNQMQVLEGKQGSVCWLNELIWREFYRHIVVAFPKVCRQQSFKPNSDLAQWNDNKQDFELWSHGNTGYPIVDAAIKQLLNTGWMHNRLRMIVAMFLSKHLLIDWRKGEAFFNYYLVDADFCSNNGGWQWSASTGADSVPYFRIFNPITQAKRFDPEGEFICHYLPKLKPLPAKLRHFPQANIRQSLDYPQAMVEHKFAYQRALKRFAER